MSHFVEKIVLNKNIGKQKSLQDFQRQGLQKTKNLFFELLECGDKILFRLHRTIECTILYKMRRLRVLYEPFFS